VIEPVSDFGRQHSIQQREIDDHSGQWINVATDRDVARIAMAVEPLARTQAEHLLVPFVRPLRTPIAMRRGECHAAREKKLASQTNQG